MNRNLFEAKYYESYYFAYVVKNILDNRFVYLRTLDGFYSDEAFPDYIVPFQHKSALHWFISFVVNLLTNEEIGKIDIARHQQIARNFASNRHALEEMRPKSLPINEASDNYGIEHLTFEEWLKGKNRTFFEASDDDVFDYYRELQLDGTSEELVDQVTPEVFFILFQNRRLLLLFNEMMASQVTSLGREMVEDDCAEHFSRTGVLKRVKLPQWVQRAVFFRDRGHCTACHRDLSGILSIDAGNNRNYDHIVPLARGGLNDVTNIQLLCRDCNSKKLHHRASTSDYYENWY